MTIQRRSRTRPRPGRKIIILVLVLLLVFGFGKGLVRIGRLLVRKHIEEQRLEQVREEKELLEAEIGRLEADSLYIEEIARREYGMVREGEEAFRLTLPDSAGNGE